eukprot:5971980-Alexandrium_andersonii.AAC.1
MEEGNDATMKRMTNESREEGGGRVPNWSRASTRTVTGGYPLSPPSVPLARLSQAPLSAPRWQSKQASACPEQAQATCDCPALRAA